MTKTVHVVELTTPELKKVISSIANAVVKDIMEINSINVDSIDLGYKLSEIIGVEKDFKRSRFCSE